MTTGLRRILLCGALLLLAACARSEGDAGGGCRPATGGDIALQDWCPLPAAAADAALQASRERILGPGATDPGTVKLWWVGVSSFIASMGGHLFLFDAWEIVGVHRDYLPIGREELAALQPEAILIGHGHFDHAADMGYVAGRSGATVVGGDGICRLARQQAARDGLQDRFPCLVLGNAQVPMAGALQRVKLWADLPELHIIRHPHSAADAADLANGGAPSVFVPELITYLQQLNTDPQEIAWTLESLDDEGGFGQPSAGTWLYHLRIGEFALLWHDSAGPIDGDDADAVAVRGALETLPGCVDVQLGAIVSFGQFTSGLRDARLYVQHAHPRVSLPTHHDAWAPVAGPGAAALEDEWRAEIAALPHPPELDYLRDPQDYLAVRSYRVDDPRWKQPMPGSSCASAPSS